MIVVVSTLKVYYDGVKGHTARLPSRIEGRPVYKEISSDSDMKATFAAQCVHIQEVCRTVEAAGAGQCHSLLQGLHALPR
jgi:hypothetical protein